MKKCSDNNNNSIKCYEYFNTEDNFLIIMELCDCNFQENLNTRLDDNRKCFSIEEIYERLNQLNNTFRIMVKNNIIHQI